MRAIAILCVASLVAAHTVQGQEPPPRRQELQQQVVQRFMENFRVQAGLSEEQYKKFQEQTRRAFDERAGLLQKERDLWMALEAQMRPGVAASADSVTAILGAMNALQEQRFSATRAEQREYAQFLSPIQQAHLALAWRRLQTQMERVRGVQRPAAAPRRPER